MVRNVANMVPTYESGPSETNAALEFAVNSLQVENILIIGHIWCGGIRALMSMQDEVDSSGFIRSWVIVGNNAKLSIKAAASNLNFDQQCTHCEKVLSFSWRLGCLSPLGLFSSTQSKYFTFDGMGKIVAGKS
ncbi:hypothetical protein PTKIN_Ptkin10aG0107600 [Pterospermum kingtungense]